MFIDDFSRYAYVYLLMTKNEALEAFKEYMLEVENQTEKKIKELRYNKCGEYTSQHFDDYYKDPGIVHSITPYSP